MFFVRRICLCVYTANKKLTNPNSKYVPAFEKLKVYHIIIRLCECCSIRINAHIQKSTQITFTFSPQCVYYQCKCHIVFYMYDGGKDVVNVKPHPFNLVYACIQFVASASVAPLLAHLSRTIWHTYAVSWFIL